MNSIFLYDDYKKYLLEAEISRRSFERGFRSKLAKVIESQNAYVSHVLNGDSHFSLEQAIAIADFFEMKKQERKYFLVLVELARAGTRKLKAHFAEEAKLLREEDSDVQVRLDGVRALPEQEKSVYYSSWHYLAVHVLASLPEYNNHQSIAKALSIPEDLTKKVLQFLIQNNILIVEGEELKSGLTQVFLSRESSHRVQHHTNLRLCALQALSTGSFENLHYSTLSSLSEKDARALKAEMIDLIEKYGKTVAPSKEEVAFGFNLDFYNLIQSK